MVEKFNLVKILVKVGGVKVKHKAQYWTGIKQQSNVELNQTDALYNL